MDLRAPALMHTILPCMKDLPTYLNDHLGGSVGALEMLGDMIDTQKGKPLEGFLETLRDDIEADQNELKRLMKNLGIDESAIKKTGAWVAEKFSRAKLRIGDSGEPNLQLLQSLESLSLGITGKQSLWRMLGATAESTPRLRAFDFARLRSTRGPTSVQRVETQAREIECAQARCRFRRSAEHSPERLLAGNSERKAFERFQRLQVRLAGIADPQFCARKKFPRPTRRFSLLPFLKRFFISRFNSF